MSHISQIHKMICFITDYENWDHKINENVLKFYAAYQLYPNLLLSSKATWEKIDKAANENNAENINSYDNDIDVIDNEIQSISSFVTSEYELEFCLDEKMSVDTFVLVFDEDPTFDGEPLDHPENENTVYTRIA